MKSRAIRVIGHRGTGEGALENTVRAMRDAVALGVDGVEFDVRATHDGEPVVIHDSSLDRTTNGSGAVAKVSLSQLKKLDTADGEKIPTVQEILTELHDSPLILITFDIKVPNIEHKLLDLIQHYRIDDRVILSSFLPQVLINLRALNPTIATAFLYSNPIDNPIAITKKLGANGLHPKYHNVSAELVSSCQKSDLFINPWTVNEEASMRQMIKWGVNGIITDLPERLLSILK